MMVRWNESQEQNIKRIAEPTLVCVVDAVRNRRLGWFGHLEQTDISSDDWLSSCKNIEVMGAKSRGSGKKTLGKCVGHDLV
jgi:hypothetical protein